MDKLCRVCVEYATKCTPLGNKIGNSSSLSFLEFFNKCTNLDASESDKLPQNLCSNCAKSFQTFYPLVKLAEKSDIVFREALKISISTETYNNGEISCEEITISNGETKEKILVLDTRSIANLQDADDSNEPFFLEETGETKNEDSLAKDSDIQLIGSEKIPLSTSKKKLYSYKVEGDPVERKDSKNVPALDVLTNGHQKSKNRTQFEKLLMAHRNKKLPKNRKVYGQNFKLHIGDHSGTTDEHNDTARKFDCSLCNKEYKTKANLREHMDFHRGIKYKCNQCGKEFAFRPSLRRHIAVHRDERPFKCETCEKRFKQKSTYVEHLNVHKNISYKCPKCHKLYKTKQFFLLHMKEHRGIIERFECNFCHKTYTKKYNLKVHISSFHTGDQVFKCETCHITFKSEKRYTKHMKNCIKIVLPNSQNIENGDHVDTGLSEEIKMTTARGQLDSLCGGTEVPVLYYYKAKDLADNNYFEITDECITESSKNS